METQYFKNYSPALGRDMEMKRYGHAGRPVLFVPCQNGRFYDFENFHMADVWQPWIDAGRVMVYAIDTLDQETWSDTNGDPGWRSYRHEQWMSYIFDEVVPFIRGEVNARNGWTGEPGVIAFGCSLGATHAAHLFYRRPDEFGSSLHRPVQQRPRHHRGGAGALGAAGHHLPRARPVRRKGHRRVGGRVGP